MKISQNKTETENKFLEDIETIPGTTKKSEGGTIISILRDEQNIEQESYKNKHPESNKKLLGIKNMIAERKCQQKGWKI